MLFTFFCNIDFNKHFQHSEVLYIEYQFCGLRILYFLYPNQVRVRHLGDDLEYWIYGDGQDGNLTYTDFTGKPAKGIVRQIELLVNK